MWENLKQNVKKMVDKKHELEDQYRTQRDRHIEELAMMVASRIQADISESVRKFDDNYLRCSTVGSVQVDNIFKDVSFGKHLGMTEDRIKWNVPDWIIISEVRPWDHYTNIKLIVEYIIDEDRV